MTVLPAEQRIQPHDSSTVASLLLLVTRRSVEAASCCCESLYETTVLVASGAGLAVAMTAKKSENSIIALAVKRLKLDVNEKRCGMVDVVASSEVKMKGCSEVTESVTALL